MGHYTDSIREDEKPITNEHYVAYFDILGYLDIKNLSRVIQISLNPYTIPFSNAFNERLIG